MTVKRIWDWAEFLKIASEYFLIPQIGCEYDFETCDVIVSTHGHSTMKASKTRKPSSEKLSNKNGGLSKIPLTVNLSSASYLKNLPLDLQEHVSVNVDVSVDKP